MNAWAKKYLNMGMHAGRGLLGYAQFPGGPQRTDSVVILNHGLRTTGSVKAPFNLGRSAAHEVRHWLNLRHIWATKTLAEATLSLTHRTPPVPTRQTEISEHQCGNGRAGTCSNYMDYVDDDAMMMFTTQQAFGCRLRWTALAA
jgi:hypothetical protein